jgi:large subunit ribosomal protein L15
MDLSNLKPAEGSIKAGKRIGRGQGSGRGGTSTRGHKGAKSRSGYKSKAAFEGGQMPIQRRLPKFGFKNINRVEFVPLNLDKLQYFAEQWGVTKIDLEILSSKGIVNRNEKVKLLGRGALTAKLEIEVNAASDKAKEAIEKAGGSVKLV